MAVAPRDYAVAPAVVRFNPCLPDLLSRYRPSHQGYAAHSCVCQRSKCATDERLSGRVPTVAFECDFQDGSDGQGAATSAIATRWSSSRNRGNSSDGVSHGPRLDLTLHS